MTIITIPLTYTNLIHKHMSPTLSVSISAMASSSATESPTSFIHLMSPSVIDSANGGTSTVLISASENLNQHRIISL